MRIKEPKERIKFIVEKRLEGAKIQEIADFFNISKQAVSEILIRYGAPKMKIKKSKKS